MITSSQYVPELLWSPSLKSLLSVSPGPQEEGWILLRVSYLQQTLPALEFAQDLFHTRETND